MIRRFLGVLAGLATLVATAWLLEAISNRIWPPPIYVVLADPAELAALFERIPFAAKVAELAGWFLGALAGAWVAHIVSRWAPVGWIVTGIAVAFLGMALFVTPYPLWMQIAAIMALALGGWVGLRVSLPRSAV